MKDLILTKAICVITATLTAAMFMWSVALTIPAAAQDRLAENPDIHDPHKWQLWHAESKLIKKGYAGHYCRNRCLDENYYCNAKYNPAAGVNAQVAGDCNVLERQCLKAECSRYPW